MAIVTIIFTRSAMSEADRDSARCWVARREMIRLQPKTMVSKQYKPTR